MKKKEWFTLIIVVIIVAVIASFATIKLTGNVIEGSYTVRANSCDADTICEVAKTISTRTGSTSALTLTSDVKKVIVEGSLSAGKVFINEKTVSTNIGSTSALTLTSDVKKVIVEGSLSAGKVFINEKSVSTNIGSTSALTLTSDVKKVIVEGSLLATNLAGNGSAYVCVDKTGNLYRSSISCKS